MRNYLIFLILGFTSISFLSAQSIIPHDEITPTQEYDNIWVKEIASDSLASSFIIFIKKEVTLHKHLKHTEYVAILEGSGMMRLGELTKEVKVGDIIYIPENTPHSVKVTSKQPMKVLSIQSPFFDGKDRILLEN